MKRYRGFTLIELVIVIVILGILAAFAVPRFADFRRDARISVIKGMEGSLHAAQSIAHARQQVDGASTPTSVSLDGQAVTMDDGFPTGDVAGIVAALQSTAGFTVEATAGSVVNFRVIGTATGDCYAQYSNTAGTQAVARDETDC